MLDRVIKALESVALNLLWQQVLMDVKQFRFMPGISNTDTIFIVRQLQEKLRAVHKTQHKTSVNLEKASAPHTEHTHIRNRVRVECYLSEKVS